MWNLSLDAEDDGEKSVEPIKELFERRCLFLLIGCDPFRIHKL
jgi:hypothetical protein